jgi:hypothetical protein
MIGDCGQNNKSKRNVYIQGIYPNMTVRKVILCSLIIPVLLSVRLLSVSREWDDLLWIIIFIFALWVGTLLLGLVLAVIVRRPKAEPYLYLSIQIAVVLAIGAIWIDWQYKSWRHERDAGNIDENHFLMEIGEPPFATFLPKYIQTAFLKLESSFADANSFRLAKYAAIKRDTLVNSSPDTVAIVYFTYLKGDKIYIAKVRVFRDVAVINSLDADLRLDDEDRRGKIAFHGGGCSAEDMMKYLKSLDLPDSLKERLIKTMDLK